MKDKAKPVHLIDKIEAVAGTKGPSIGVGIGV
jgi:hypothetical protein